MQNDGRIRGNPGCYDLRWSALIKYTGGVLPELVEISKLPAVTFLYEGYQRLKIGGYTKDRIAERNEAEEGRVLVVGSKTYNTIILRNRFWDLPTQLLRRWPRVG